MFFEIRIDRPLLVVSVRAVTSMDDGSWPLVVPIQFKQDL